MRIEGSGFLQNLYGASVHVTAPKTSAAKSLLAQKEDAQSLVRVGELLRGFQRMLDDGRSRVGSASRTKMWSDVRLYSSSSLGLSEDPSAAVLQSSSSLGGTLGTHLPGTPTWNATEKPAVTFGGTYDGSSGDQTLTLRATSSGTIGVDDITLDVVDESDTVLEQLTFSSSYTAGTDVTLANGLTVALGDGVVAAGDEFDVDVAYTVTDPEGTYTPSDPTWSWLSKPTTAIGGTYDGSSGSQTLTFTVMRAGDVGTDALTIDVRDEADQLVERIQIASDYAPDTEITLANGMTLTLGTGTMNVGDEFTVDVDYSVGPDQNSFSPGTPAWSSGSTAAASVGGTYDGSNGTQTLTFLVSSGGTIGVDDVLIDVLDQNGQLLEQLTVASGYQAGTDLTLANGLTVAFADGDAFGGDQFQVDVVNTPGTPQSSYTPNAPTWTPDAKPTPTLGGTYDGSNGSQTLTFQVSDGGLLGDDAFVIDVLDENGSLLEQLLIAADYQADTPIQLANGMTLALGAGLAAVGDEFTVDVAYDAGGVQSSFSPDTGWTSTAKAAAVVRGEYDGSNGSQTLTFRVANDAVVGTDAFSVEVLDENGSVLEQLDFASDYVADTELTLSNGLTLKLGDGSLAAGDEFTIDVATGLAVDPAQAFDGSGGSAPTFPSGGTVVDGSFELNGTTIDVYASDSIDSVLARINAADLGVTATYDSDAGKVVLTHDTVGAAGSIVVENDTSGFLAATELDDATLVAGADGDFDDALATVASLSGVQSGTLVVNGQSISIDVDTDSLDDVVAQIQALGVGLEYSDSTGKFLLHDKGKIEIDDGDTGFFASLGIADGEYGEAAKSRGFGRPDEVAKALEDLAKAWNSLFDEKLAGSGGRQADSLRAALKLALDQRFAADGQGSTRGGVSTLGISFDFGKNGQIDFALDEEELGRALAKDAEKLEELLLGSDERAGLFDVFAKALKPTANVVDALLENRGLATLDLYA
ncbi:MAG: hypothetical protein L6Q99_02685 [Planctomycetes bacterium]|nr:hypothetical protein [Planctomycetota bacterium]